ncbi:MAG: biotin--[acetyl-CoA-carboxylase] ligase [Bacteroides sp.]|nr:biotin--[acetyl-CoA-carboxylase] ligase [Bacteroides sp.]MCM1379107.1 biotin--[acetyl-CoA-carboxylase] ligase [Bacteroides sp.]MCM1445805.1 biotin--[acetyl-CoA-carboxylase] ligase [Prevotella sp.]
MALTIIESCPSSNSALPRTAAHGDALMALEQTAGRGQRGNTWEAEPRKNITLSLMLRPEGLPAVRQFELSEAVALGVADLVEELGVGDVRVKWPNDIYVGDRKICGILIENALSGNLIGRSIAGIGLNVNQTEFRSDAPNPVSLRQLTGREYDLKATAERMIALIISRLGRDNHAEYRSRLWRGMGEWLWRTPGGEIFSAAIVDVLPDGRLCLSGRRDPYPFKSVFPA